MTNSNFLTRTWRRIRFRIAHDAVNRFTARYLRKNPGLASRIDSIQRDSKSTGCNLADYVALYVLVRTLKPRLILECGTGMSTHIIAQAMLDESGGQPVDAMKLISMDDVLSWRDHNDSLLPDEFRAFTEIIYSPAIEYGFSFVRGTAYEEVPDYPYQLVFVDGPTDTMADGSTACNMDFVRVVRASQQPVWGVIDNRKRTVMAYQAIFGRHMVHYYPAWNLSVIPGATCSDLRLEDNEAVSRRVQGGEIGLDFGFPFGLRS